MTRTREIGRDPQLDAQFEHTEDEILTKLCEKYSIDRRYVGTMYGRTLVELARDKIQTWDKELKELIEKLKSINIEYAERYKG